jgi:hypothetical protein
MTLAGWLIAAALAVLLGWLGLALVGVVRELSRLRERVAALESEAEPVHVGSGLAVGRRAPTWSITTAAGDEVTSASVAGTRYLLVFADADCRACDVLVPSLVRASAAGALPRAVIVGRGDAATMPASWRSGASGVERDGVVSEAFEVEVSPHVFVVDEGGSIVAQGGAVDLPDVEALVGAGRGIQIVSGAADG